VATSPTCSVAPATADSCWRGSNHIPGRYSLRNSAVPGLSGRKIESMIPRSAICASSTRLRMSSTEAGSVSWTFHADS
jgi:hypothetical protein